MREALHRGPFPQKRPGASLLRAKHALWWYLEPSDFRTTREELEWAGTAKQVRPESESPLMLPCF